MLGEHATMYTNEVKMAVHVLHYRIAENIGGSKNWRIWQKDDCSPNLARQNEC